MRSLIRVFLIFINIMEIYIPAIALTALFIVFNVQIFYRYVLNEPIVWGNEVSLTLFLWAVLFGAAYSWRKKDHVTFTVIYDIIPPLGQIWMRIVGNLIVVISLAIALPGIYGQLVFYQRLSSSLLNIPLNILYSPILISFLLIIFHCIVDLFQDGKKLSSRSGDYSETIYKDEFEEDTEEGIPTALKD